MSEELKPCPFFGVDVYKTSNINMELFHDPSRGNELRECPLGYINVSYEEWQNAYCWKQLAEKDSRIKELKLKAEEEEASAISWMNDRDLWIRRFEKLKKENDRLERMAEKMVDALELAEEHIDNGLIREELNTIRAEYREMRGKP
jgi:DNA gyrase/topoisomerase IV subunit A